MMSSAEKSKRYRERRGPLTSEEVAERNRRSREYRARHPEKQRAREEAWRQRNPHAARDRARKKLGIPNPPYPAPLCCELCNKEAVGRLMVPDHCHTTGVFRGWLCMACNCALGVLGDNVDGLRQAIKYMEKALGS